MNAPTPQGTLLLATLVIGLLAGGMAGWVWCQTTDQDAGYWKCRDERVGRFVNATDPEPTYTTVERCEWITGTPTPS